MSPSHSAQGRLVRGQSSTGCSSAPTSAASSLQLPPSTTALHLPAKGRLLRSLARPTRGGATAILATVLGRSIPVLLAAQSLAPGALVRAARRLLLPTASATGRYTTKAAMTQMT